MKTIPCISLWQPWGSLCVITSQGQAPKRIETRHWPIPKDYRGPLAIHAAKRMVKRELMYYSAHWGFRAALAPLGVRTGQKEDLWDLLPFGALIGVVNVVDCRPVEEFTLAELETPRYAEDDTERLNPWTERMLGNYAPGRFGWVFEEPRQLPKPVAYNGQQGLFRVSTDLLGDLLS